MLIAPFKLPSDESITIQFTKPSVSIAMQYANTTPFIEESATTQYLNQLQVKGDGYSDSRTWTMQDRRTALWWIYVESNVDTALTAMYECPRCTEANRIDLEMKLANGEISKMPNVEVNHAVDYDATEFADELRYLTVKPYQETTLYFNNEPKKARLFPLNGASAEEMEMLRNELEYISDENKREEHLANMRIARLCYQFSLEGEPEDPEEAKTYRFNLIESMSVGDEFEDLVAKIAQMNIDLTHGLKISIYDGVARLLVPRVHVCPKYKELTAEQRAKESKEAYTTQLWITFRNIMLFPKVRSERLADINYKPSTVRKSAR